VGIAKENLSKLFLNFSRLEDHQKSNERGTGLGLSICKSLLEKMGGTVTVESEGLGFGTTFIMQMQAKCKVLPAKMIVGYKTSAMNLSNNLNRHHMMKS
jgi:K+-sensing histidine kinase KdpD